MFSSFCLPLFHLATSSGIFLASMVVPTTEMSGFLCLALVILWFAFSRGASSNAVRRMGSETIFDPTEPETEEEEEERRNPNIL